MNEQFANTARQIHLALIQSPTLEGWLSNPSELAATAICHAAAIEAAIARHESEAIANTPHSNPSKILGDWNPIAAHRPNDGDHCWINTGKDLRRCIEVTCSAVWRDSVGWCDDNGNPIKTCPSNTYWQPIDAFPDRESARASFVDFVVGSRIQPAHSPSLNLEWQQLSYAKPQQDQECWVVHRPAESDEIKHITVAYWSGEWQDGNGNPINEGGINQAYHSDILWIPSSQFASLEEARTDALEFAFDPF